MNSNNSGTSDPHRLLLNLKDKIHLKRTGKYVALSNLSMYYMEKYKSHKNSKFNISAPMWNEEFELPDGSYSNCVKSVCILSFSGSHFPAFRQNTNQKNFKYGQFSHSVCIRY